MYLGEVVNQQGQRWELQLKGAGLTPYRCALRARSRPGVSNSVGNGLMVLWAGWI